MNAQFSYKVVFLKTFLSWRTGSFRAVFLRNGSLVYINMGIGGVERVGITPSVSDLAQSSVV